MSKSLIDIAFEQIKKGLFEELKPRMLMAMEWVSTQAWAAAMQCLEQAPAGEFPTSPHRRCQEEACRTRELPKASQ